MKLSIGQVSKIFEISKDTLRYYDKIGILKPDITENNGYRYYSLHHIEKLGLILGTKYLGISLADIKTTIEREDINEYKSLVIRQEEIIKQKIKELKKLEEELKESKVVLNKIINFKNEYDFSKLKIRYENYNLYGVTMEDILNSDFYKNYVVLLEKETDYINGESYFYIYKVLENKEIKEDENIVFIKENEYNKDIIKNYLNEEKIEIINKIIKGKIVSTNFYGTIDQINDYIISMNKYFNCNKNNEAYVMYEFYLPKKDNDAMYFVNISLNT